MGHGTPSTFGDGTWWTTVPIVLSGDQIVGSGRVDASEDGPSGTLFRACDGNSPCKDPSGNLVYFKNPPPLPNAPVFNSFTTGNLNGTYYIQIVWLVNLATGCDSQQTGSWSTWPGNVKPIYAGECIQDSTPNTEMALNRGTTKPTGTPPWSGSKGGTTTDGSVTWLNVGSYNTAASTYGTPGLSLAGTADVESPVNRGIIYNAPTVPSYPTCNNGNPYTDGTYVLNPGGTDTYRAIGSGTATQCNLLNPAAGSQTLDGSFYWQEVGPPSNYINPVGYLVVASTTNPATSGFYPGQVGTIQSNSGCTPVQIGALTACAMGSSYTLSSYSTTGQHSPMIDTTHPLIVLGEKQNNSNEGATFMTRAQDLTADANNIAGEACLYVYSQEQSGCYAVNAISGTEASIAAIGPGASDSMLWDFTAGNPASGPVQQERVAGVFLDGRDGEPMKTVLHGTITPYNTPTGTSANSVLYGLWFVGGKNIDITIESVHTEAAQNGITCAGDPANNQAYPICWILSTDPGGGGLLAAPEINAVQIGQQVGTAIVNVIQNNANNALEDITTGVPIDHHGSGTYILGQFDASGSRLTMVPQGGELQTFDGPLFLNDGNNGGSPSAGSVGFNQGADVSGVWASSNVATIEGPPTTFTSYRLSLPAGGNSGILQGALSSGVVAASFSGDSNHSNHFVDKTSTIMGSCPASSGGCNIPGLYRLSFYLYSTTSSCTGGTPQIGPIQISYLDRSGSTKTANVPLFSSGTIKSSISLSGSDYAWGTVTVWSTGVQAITYQTLNYSGCGTGTAQYELDATIEQLQSFP
jgi:hypothetical protein